MLDTYHPQLHGYLRPLLYDESSKYILEDTWIPDNTGVILDLFQLALFTKPNILFFFNGAAIFSASMEQDFLYEFLEEEEGIPY